MKVLKITENLSSLTSRFISVPLYMLQNWGKLAKTIGG